MAAPSPEQIAYMMAHADDDVRVNIVVCVSVCAFLSVVFVATRLFARWLHGNNLLLADYLIIFALVRCQLRRLIPDRNVTNENGGCSVFIYHFLWHWEYAQTPD